MRLIPRVVEKKKIKEPIYCFAVGKELTMNFASFVVDYCQPVMRKEQRFTGATVKPLKFDDDDEE